MSQFYLKPNVQIEPLFNKWHAHSYIIPPATAAMYVRNAHVNNMQSYIRMPMAHAAALKDPDLIGGPFLDLEGQKVNEVKQLVQETVTNLKPLIDFSEGIITTYRLLRTKAKGQPLAGIYEEIPAIVKGYVELVYDLENRPTVRFLERLLYKSSFYNQSVQSIALSLIRSDNRPFILSTPRLEMEDTLHLPISYTSEAYDALIRLKTQAKSLDEIKELLGLQNSETESFQKFLTAKAPREVQKFDGDGVRIRYFGHACLLFESKDVTVMSDPLISYQYPTELPRFTFEDIPESIDYVVITHTHHDHIVIETLLQLRNKIKNIIVPRSGNGYLEDPSMKLILENIGFKSVIEIDDMETIQAPGLEITGIPFFGEHCDLNIRSKSAYLIKFPHKSMLVAADSNGFNADVYENVHERVGDIDMFFVGLECTGAPMSWAYGPLFPEKIDRDLDQIRRSNGSNYETVMEMIRIFSFKEVYLYAMGLEPWLNYFMALQHQHEEASDHATDQVVAQCKDKGIIAEKLYALKEMIR